MAGRDLSEELYGAPGSAGGRDLSEELYGKKAAIKPTADIRGEMYDKAMNYSGRDAVGGFIRGAGSIGSTLARPFETASENQQRRTRLDENMASLIGANPDSMGYKTNKLIGEVAGTSGIGGVLAKPFQALSSVAQGSRLAPVMDGMATSMQTGGFRVGDIAGNIPRAAARIAGGASVGGASAGLVDPKDAQFGAMVGGGLPAAAGVAGYAGNAIRNGLVGEITPEARALAEKAKQLGIDIPADRLTNSKPLNAVASSLNYIPFSGRAETEAGMNSQLNKALSNTFGQDSSNVTMSLRKAKTELGGEFDRVLKSNTVKFDQQFFNDLTESSNLAAKELGQDGANIIKKQVDDILSKVNNGEIDGQTAYNIKRSLDRIGQRTTPEAFYANDLKKTLMSALDRSMSSEGSAAFAKTRQQYGNMLDLQRLAKNGADGEVSVARLSNMQNINNKPMQDIADIAAQFVKPREGQHGAAQRVFGAGGAGVAAMLAAMGIPMAGAGAVAAGGVMGAGRATNSVLNSNAAKNMVLRGGLLGDPEPLGYLTQGAYRALPLLNSD